MSANEDFQQGTPAPAAWLGRVCRPSTLPSRYKGVRSGADIGAMWGPRFWSRGRVRETVMDFRAFLAAAVLILGGAVNVAAQETVDGTNVDAVANIARGYGSVTIDKASNSDPLISGKIEGVSYYVYFRNCSDSNTACEDLNFYAGFLDNKQTMEAINAWNRDKRFGKAYLDADLDAVIEFDVNLEYGVTPKNLDSTFGVWSLILEQYAEYIGFQR
ncbi:MAG: YbjN domain-containing protein [Hyphomicrobiales bacterium]|nr:MAG: YbjN domain-containing protein [Hyphomicrobiales bacterium]